MPKKPRSDAKLKSLPPHQRDMLVRWLVDENLSYEKAKERLAADFSIETSTGALSEFYGTQCFTLRYSQARDLAETIGAAMATAPEKFDEATIALVKQKAFERAVAKDGDIKELGILASILGDTAKLKIKQQEIALSERRVALLEKKAALTDQATAIAKDETLSEEEQGARMRALFRM